MPEKQTDKWISKETIFTFTAGAIAAWQFGTRWWENRQAKNGSDYWRGYYHEEVVKRSDEIREVRKIRSTGVKIHLDLYPRTESDAPVIILNHGAVAYCRMFVSMALALYDLGYTVVLPDQRGQGFSGGARGDFTIEECTQNILDAALWAKRNFDGPLFIAGGSLGGALSYYAAAAGAPVNAIACLDLFDFGNGLDGLQISRLASAANHPNLSGRIIQSMVFLKPVYWLRIPFYWVGAFENLMDDEELAFMARWEADPVPARTVTLRSILSNLTTPPAVTLEQNTVPTLVLNQRDDEMVNPAVTRRNYERLGGSKKYLELPYAHWSARPEFGLAIVNACDQWFKAHISRD